MSITKSLPASDRAALTARDVAALLSISPRHLDTLVADGRIPRPVRLGKVRRWSRDAIERWLDAEHERVNGGAA